MPSQLVNNDAIQFICARDFLYNGVEYKMGEDFDQTAAIGHIDLLVRTRRVFAVVDSTDEKPRHWHHHVWVRSDIETKLGLVEGSSGFNRAKQMDLEQPTQDYDVLTPWDETPDNAKALAAKALAGATLEEVLEQENEEGKYSDENEYIDPETGEEETEPQVLVHPEETDEDDYVGERQIDESDLYDPSEHGVNEVLEYLTGDITDEERDRVLAAEAVGKNRKGIINA